MSICVIHNCCGETYRRALSCLLPNEELFFLPIRDVLNEKAEVAEFTYIIGRKDVEEKCREQSPSSIFSHSQIFTLMATIPMLATFTTITMNRLIPCWTL